MSTEQNGGVGPLGQQQLARAHCTLGFDVEAAAGKGEFDTDRVQCGRGDLDVPLGQVYVEVNVRVASEIAHGLVSVGLWFVTKKMFNLSVTMMCVVFWDSNIGKIFSTGWSKLKKNAAIKATN